MLFWYKLEMFNSDCPYYYEFTVSQTFVSDIDWNYDYQFQINSVNISIQELNDDQIVPNIQIIRIERSDIVTAVGCQPQSCQPQSSQPDVTEFDQSTGYLMLTIQLE